MEPVTVEVPPFCMFSQVATAIERASQYWIEGLDVKKPARWGSLPWLPEAYRYESGAPDAYAAPFAGGCIYIKATGEKKWRRVDRWSLSEGAAAMLKLAPLQFGNMVADRGDDETADVFLQCCLFQEIRYG